MKTGAIARSVHQVTRRKALLLAGIAIFAFIGITIAQMTRYFIGGSVSVSVGSVAPRDIRAPRRITYISDVETNRQRDLAEASVPPVFTAPDSQIARQQLSIARELMNQIAQIRANRAISESDHLKELAALPGLGLSEGIARAILGFDDSRWARIDAQVITLLDEALRSPIRPDNLDSVKVQLPNKISLNFNPDEAVVIGSLAVTLLVPNTNYDAPATAAARKSARDAVRPVERTFEQNQIIVRSGQVVGPADVEVLDKLSIRRASPMWSDVLSALLLSGLAVFTIGLAMLYGRENALNRHVRLTALSACVFVGALFLGRLLLPGHQLLPYMAPLVAVSVMVTSWSGTLVGVVSALVLAGLVGIVFEQPIEMVTFWSTSGIVASLVMRRVERISDYIRASVLAWLVQIVALLAFHINTTEADGAMQLATLGLVTSAGNLVSATLAPALLYVVGLVLDIMTPVQIVELSRPSHPLLQQMMMQAPGTYHHSLMLANLAEQAAERIGADSLLTRVGAYYHDIGKLTHPYFFIENQLEGMNVHDQLDPQTSSRILQNHVVDGLALARKYRLPSQIYAFVAEHHGTTKTNFQYVKATQASDEPVDDTPFRYPGPRPQSKETALVMLADGCEAIVRARRPAVVEETDALLRKVISERIADHQLDDTDLTLRDLEIIRQSFLDTLRGAYHPRIEYPEIARPTLKPESLPPEQAKESVTLDVAEHENA